jgi:hypothetical protein
VENDADAEDADATARDNGGESDNAINIDNVDGESDDSSEFEDCDGSG